MKSAINVLISVGLGKNMRDPDERPDGVIIKELCLCGCGEHIIHSYNRIKRRLPPPLWKWGHFGRINLKKFRFKKNNVPWNKNKKHSKKSIQKMRDARKRYYREKKN